MINYQNNFFTQKKRINLMLKLRVGVLMGGKSIEREVSFNSGRTICDHLDTQRYLITPLFQTPTNHLYILPWHFLHRGKISDFEHRLASEATEIKWDNLKKHIDFVYIAMHGHFAEDGTMQGLLEVLGIPYFGSKVFGSALSMDKAMQKKFLQLANINVPRDITLLPEAIIHYNAHKDSILKELHAKEITFPCIVKPHKEGSSFGVSVVHQENQLEAALTKACFVNKKPQTVLIEQKIKGMEFTCITITDYQTNTIRALAPTEIVADQKDHIFNYEQKYMPGKATEFTPARCIPSELDAIKKASIDTMRALNLQNMARIDGFLTECGSVVIIDPNSFSGAAPNSFLFREAAFEQMSHTQIINHLIETELESYGMLASIISQEQKEALQMNTKKIRVGILLGGPSNEREISLESGRNITYKLSPHKYQATPLFVSQQMELFPLTQQQLVLNSTHEIAESVNTNTKIMWHDLSSYVDFIFIALHGGPGENGAVQGTLEMLGVPYNGSSVLSSALCMDKFKTTQFLGAQGFDVPHGILLTKQDWFNDQKKSLQQILKTIPLPLIVKPHDDGCSVMVQKAKTEHDLQAALDTIFSHDKEYALVEECVRGMELTVGVIGNENPRALPPSQAVCATDILSIEEKFLPGAGENQTPAPLPAATLLLVQKTIEDVFKAVGAKGYARIDCFYQTPEQSNTGKERVVILEINSLPGMTPATCIFHQAAEVGIKPMDFIDQIITLGFQEHSTTAHATVSEKIKELV
jgi:D-alanine--D-alanine ligase